MLNQHLVDTRQVVNVSYLPEDDSELKKNKLSSEEAQSLVTDAGLSDLSDLPVMDHENVEGAAKTEITLKEDDLKTIAGIARQIGHCMGVTL